MLQHLSGKVNDFNPIRFLEGTGRYESAAYYDGILVGPNFEIERGKGYIFNMLQPASGVNLH